MSDYTWGVDGYGHAHISKKGSNVILFCMIKGNGIGGVWILEAQDNDRYFYGVEFGITIKGIDQ